MINSCAKGKRAERAWAKVCQDHGYDVRRGQQHSGLEGEDCVGLPGIWQEVKWDNTIKIEAGMDQAVRDCNTHNFNLTTSGPTREDWRIPIFALKRDRKSWKVIMRLPDLATLHGSECKRELGMILVELDSESWFKVFKEYEKKE